MKRKMIWLGLLCLMHGLIGCVEEFDAQINNLETALVVDARLTNELRPQSILLSNTFDFDAIDPNPETGAEVVLVDDLNNTIDFIEDSPGVYTSANAMQLTQGRTYTLEITRTDGSRFLSTPQELPSETAIAAITPTRVINNSGLEGVAIVLDVEGNSADTGPDYYRYEYLETTKIVAPDFNPFAWDEVDYDFFCEDDDPWDVTIAVRQDPAKVCFASANSNDLILASTEELVTNSLEGFEVRFLSKENYYIAHRYSILVKQYHLDAEAASFYQTLSDFSNNESVFSNVQTGLIEGNINAENTDDLVLGYFELSSYSEKRMFFNYTDLFPDEELPPYVINCEFASEPPLYPEGFHATEIDGKIVIDGTSNSPLIDGILAGLIGYHDTNENYQVLDADGEPDRAPFVVKPLGCVDCREFGSNVAPEFWIEE